MKKRLWILIFPIMIFCICAGLLFPQIIFSKSLDKAIGQIREYSIEPVEIGDKNSIIDAMKSIFYGNYSFDYQENMANLSRDQVLNICRSFFDGLDEIKWGYDLVEINEENTVINCELYVASIDEDKTDKIQKVKMNNYSYAADTTVDGITDGEDEVKTDEKTDNTSVSAVLWTVIVEKSSDSYVEIIVDDKNEKVVQLFSYIKADEKTNDASTDFYGDETQYLQEVILPFLGNYYDVDVQMIGGNARDFIISITDADNETVMLLFDFTNGAINMTVFG